MKFMLITADPDIARHAESSSVERIFVDLESHGKAERQAHLDAHIASHGIDDVARVRAVLSTSELIVRVNPIHDQSLTEVDLAIAAGADRVMLPMFHSAEHVRVFQDYVRGRVPVTYLAETPASIVRLDSWLALLRPEDQVHIGLNDLSLGLGLTFLFEPLSEGFLDRTAELLVHAGVEFGIGGVARSGEGRLPVENVLGEHVRLKSSWAILSRAFHGERLTLRELTAGIDMQAEIEILRACERQWLSAGDDVLADNTAALRAHVRGLVRELS